MFSVQTIKRHSRKGFTLIELMIVITVIAILATIILFGLGVAQARARDSQRAAIMRGVQATLQAYAADNGGAYPGSTGAWSTDLYPTAGCGAPSGKLCTYQTTATKDPGCGSVAQQVDVRANFQPCGAGKVTYAYTTGAAGTCLSSASYTLTLTTESGSTQYFCGPQ